MAFNNSGSSGNSSVSDISTKLRKCAVDGINNGLKTWWWIGKMTVGITFAVAVLKYLGVIDILSDWLPPVFKYIGLSGEGVLVFLTGALSSLYSSVAVIATLAVDYRSATILAVMGLICHNLIMETIIQKKAGANPFFIVTLRIFAALFCAWIMNMLLPEHYSGNLIVESVKVSDGGFWSSMGDWAWQMITLLPYMLMLIVGLQILQQILKRFDLIRYLIIPLAPLMDVFGLSQKSSFLWIILNTLGLAYGGAVLISEVQNSDIDVNEAKLLNTHAAMNHSLLEDTFLYAAIGLNVAWLMIPRIILAIIAVWAQRLYINLKHKTI